MKIVNAEYEHRIFSSGGYGYPESVLTLTLEDGSAFEVRANQVAPSPYKHGDPGKITWVEDEPEA